MRILATVNFGKAQVTAAWDLMPMEKESFVVIKKDQEGNHFVIRTSNKLIKDLAGAEIAEKTHVGTLNASDGYILHTA